ncbi:nucleoside-diphosphate-sugar epimerase [Nonomuraea polychroma]|uniref:Nucleoside-diphosphate-sugar epimerase n=1 Tax=Nonomuraea polychroma TaxID=46176 RepID=A0A438M0J5_9ACTN|nr:NAD-dependent epimerase/dehydratase family protein [Nonomuraea polychroma]RVX39137.1 nucleoside-diphosphate-sugar epimerase [Nonomuraea polychroma]
MRILVLGGTAFVGHAIVSQAVARGWDVTTFNRGLTDVDVAGAKSILGDRRSNADIERLAASSTWDAIVDTSGYVPSDVLRVAMALQGRTHRYLFMSTVSVYAGWPVESLTEESATLACPPDADEHFGHDTEDGPTRYGYQKSGCEAATRLVFGERRTTLLRPGVVLGPREYVGRLPWWLRRMSEGGQVLAPGDPSRSIQPVDVRDLADFTLRSIEHDLSGPFNVTAPFGFDTFGGLISHCIEATQSTAEPVWVPDHKLISAGVRQWSEMPLWRTYPGVWQVSSARAQAAGLVCRPLRETVRDTWTWMNTVAPAVDVSERAAEIGISKERESRILESLIT